MTDSGGSNYRDGNEAPGTGQGPQPVPAVPPYPTGRAAGRPGRVIDAERLWTGGVMAGVVAAGVAVVGLLVARGIFDIAVLVRQHGELVAPSTWWYAGAAFFAALLATGLSHLLLAAAPQPHRFFGWIFGLAVTISVLAPLTTAAGLATRVAVSLINLAIGISIGSIVSGVSRRVSQILDEA
ncbi:MAG TPA: DUF6069 family protein [Kineosporiaceae bacterium]|nr:DUF6069 family protein [Kineosporiaceae bacterium]